ncbi:DNA polymerase III subunit alpha [Gryllotalpicola reticulitermitis]|uniref:DNA polymerase III subunit alpha n=1 Tax=Gryllotalpicola reticulitermitis TaxID=1184153 RepID=A0ABV8QA62_9MICO
MFTHLHVHSGYSAHLGVTPPEHLVPLAAAHGATALALTDRDGLYGAVKHIGACLTAGIRPILGAELAVFDEQGAPLGRAVVLARSDHDGRAGYAALCRAVSAAHEHSGSPAITRARLAELAIGRRMFVLLGPESDVGQAVLDRRMPDARRALAWWTRQFESGAVVVEVVCHLAEPGGAGSVTPATRMLELAELAGLSAVLTNAVRYGTPEEAATADVADSARLLLPLEDLPEVQPTGQAWLKPEALMRQVARMVLDVTAHERTADELVAATNEIAERCVLTAEDVGWKRPVMPEASVIGITGAPMAELWARARDAIPTRYAGASARLVRQVEDQLGHEMGIIEQLGFPAYFLTVAKVADLIREMGARIQARGSGVGSVLNYLLHTSGVEPISNGLIFERFLSTERLTLPDIDLDVESARRHDIYRRIFDVFGSERVTLMSMQNQYRSRGAVRDAGHALGLAPEEVDRIAKELWRFDAGEFRQALVEKPELSEFAEQVRNRRELDLLVELTERLDQLPRHVSVHPCGVILSDRTLLDRTPVQMSGLDLPMSQFDKHDMDPMGLIKLDILGVRMQSAMAHAVTEHQRLTGERIDLDAIPLDDQATFETIRSTHTLGIFQVESPGQMELVGKLQPEVFNDLTIDISLFRPGPMKNDMPLHYLQARHGEVMPDYIHPRLKPILEETRGVVVFHEQVMRLIDALTGCGLGKADVYRRWLADDRHLPDIEHLIRERGIARGFPPLVVEKVWGILKGFASFGFAKAHGAAFALPTYQSAWLKTHYPAEHMAGLLTHDPGMWPKDLIIAEARHLGIPLLPIDVQNSGLDYRLERTVDGRLGVRVAVTEVIGSSEKERQRIVNHQPFTSLQDFRDRVRPRRRIFDSLARVGALDAFIDHDRNRRHELLAHIRRVTGSAQKVPATQLAFDLDLPIPRLDGVTAMDLHAHTQTDLELQQLGVSIAGHRMTRFHTLFRELGVTPARDLIVLPGGTEVLLAGVRRATNTPPMRNGRRTVFITLDDGTGLANVVLFPDAQEKAGNRIFRTSYLLIRGRTRRSGARGISVTGEMAWDLIEAETRRRAAPASPPNSHPTVPLPRTASR